LPSRERMWDAAQPMIKFEPAIKALEPKQTDSQSMGSAIRRDGFCSSMRAGERLSQAGGECEAIGFVGRLGMILMAWLPVNAPIGGGQ
jgi:hypothetical protein